MLETSCNNGHAAPPHELIHRGVVGAPTLSAGFNPRHRKVLEPRKGWQALNLAELWRYRELLFFLVWRDVKVRYKQTVLGAAWAVLQPVMTMVVFSIFFGKLGGMSRQTTAPYPVFVYAALLPWTFFAAAVSTAGVSLITSTHLISKVYFPRLLIPAAAIGGYLVDLGISAIVMLVMMRLYDLTPTFRIALIPFFALLTLLAALGIGCLLAALTAAYRDFRYIVPFLVQIGMFASPVAYSLEVVPGRWQLVYALNPLAGMISGFRSALLVEPFRWDCIGVSMASSLVILIVGLCYFRRVERRFADII